MNVEWFTSNIHINEGSIDTESVEFSDCQFLADAIITAWTNHCIDEKQQASLTVLTLS